MTKPGLDPHNFNHSPVPDRTESDLRAGQDLDTVLFQKREDQGNPDIRLCARP